MPAEHAQDPRSRTVLLDQVGPGSEFSRRLLIRNFSSESIQARVDAVAAEVDDGAFRLREDVRTELLEWIDVTPAQLTVPGDGESAVSVGFRIPGDAPEGEHLGAILTSVVTTEGSVEVVSRVGARIYLAVDEGGSVPANFSIETMTAGRTEEGAPLVVVHIDNTGGRTLDLGGSLELRDGPGGIEAGPVGATDRATAAPGQDADVRFVLSEELPAGPWLARATIVSGLLERSAEATITFPETAGSVADPVEADSVERQRQLLIPLASSLILLLLILLLLFWWRRRREDEDRGHDEDRTHAHVGG